LNNHWLPAPRITGDARRTRINQKRRNRPASGRSLATSGFDRATRLGGWIRRILTGFNHYAKMESGFILVPHRNLEPAPDPHPGLSGEPTEAASAFNANGPFVDEH